MNFDKSSNPVFSEKMFENAVSDFAGNGVMTFQGTVTKSILLLLLVIVTGTISWKLAIVGNSIVGPLAIGGAIGALIMAIVCCFKPEKSYIFGPIYALCEGLMLGSISALFNTLYSGIVLQAILLTIMVVAVVFFAYKVGILKASNTFVKVITFATIGIGAFYLLSMLLSVFGVHTVSLFELGWVGIVIQLVIVGVAALNLVLDFNQIDRGVESNAPAHMEWYCAFGMMVTIVWIYVEILRLLALLSKRN
ncbi:MAG: Bax inhibitor-1/YccA family protein [Bacteroidales bacterium]|nr:Bax inhibitor-1/YccA family protein [Bacteroidales bacterium]